jgi:hypothetical protein
VLHSLLLIRTNSHVPNYDWISKLGISSGELPLVNNCSLESLSDRFILRCDFSSTAIFQLISFLIDIMVIEFAYQIFQTLRNPKHSNKATRQKLRTEAGAKQALERRLNRKCNYSIHTHLKWRSSLIAIFCPVQNSPTDGRPLRSLFRTSKMAKALGCWGIKRSQVVTIRQLLMALDMLCVSIHDHQLYY